METKHPFVCGKLWEDAHGEGIRCLLLLGQQKTPGHRATGGRPRACADISILDSAEGGLALVWTGGGLETVLQGPNYGVKSCGRSCVGSFDSAVKIFRVACQCPLKLNPSLHGLRWWRRNGEAVLDPGHPCGAGLGFEIRVHGQSVVKFSTKLAGLKICPKNGRSVPD